MKCVFDWREKRSNFFQQIRLQVPTKSTTLNYKGEKLDVTTDQLETIRLLGRGCYGSVSAAVIPNHPDALMAIKVKQKYEIITKSQHIRIV